MIIFCCQCTRDVDARLTNGKECYPHRNDLHALPFWMCDECRNFVGCHHKSKKPTEPLGCIANRQIKNARKHIHEILDPLWRGGKFTRKEAYKALSDRLGYDYHTADIRSIDEARKIYRIIQQIT
jgi:hypothetical protein